MILVAAEPLHDISSIPRESGDDPLGLWRLAWMLSYSPRERG